MLQENACSLFQDGYTTIVVKYNERSRPYIFKALLEDNIQVDDIVVVDNKIGDDHFAFAQVIEVHKEPQIEYNSNIVYKWIIQKVDTTKRDNIIESESQFNKILSDIERKSIKKKIADHMKEGMDEEQQTALDSAIETLQLSYKKE